MGQKGPTQQQQDTQTQLTQEQIDLAKKSDSRADTLFKLTEPGLEMTESFYKTLASGDPAAIQRSTAPATEKIAQNYNQAKTQIAENTPRGGARDLAMEETDISKAGAIGNADATAYLSAFPALASLAGEGVGLSINEVTQALSGFQGASTSNQASANMSGAGKAETLGFLGSLGSSAATGAGLAVGCWVAIALWGEKDLRTIRLRAWLNGSCKKPIRVQIVGFFYSRYGERLAKQVEAHKWVRAAVTPLFNWLNKQATKWEATWVPAMRHIGVI